MAAGVLALCFAFNFVGRGVGDTYMVFLLPLEKDFGWHRSQMTAIYSTLMFVSGLAAPLGGMVFERWGPRVLYAGGLALLGIGYFLAGKVTRSGNSRFASACSAGSASPRSAWCRQRR